VISITNIARSKRILNKDNKVERGMMRDRASKVIYHNGPLGGIFFLAYIGAAVYFVQHTHGFWGTIWALIEAIAWPAFIVFHALTLMNA
jgi:hypothetical protein